jgi:hypothetical protein
MLRNIVQIETFIRDNNRIIKIALGKLDHPRFF